MSIETGQIIICLSAGAAQFIQIILDRIFILHRKEILGRNMGPIRRTGILRNPIYGMSENIEKYMMNGRPASERDPGR